MSEGTRAGVGGGAYMDAHAHSRLSETKAIKVNLTKEISSQMRRDKGNSNLMITCNRKTRDRIVKKTE